MFVASIAIVLLKMLPIPSQECPQGSSKRGVADETLRCYGHMGVDPDIIRPRISHLQLSRSKK